MFGLFKKKRKEPEIDFSVIGTDMHSHIIPGIDDGARTIEDSIALARRFKALGYKKLIASPHVMADYFRNSPDTIRRGLDVLRKGLLQNQIDLEVEAAAEYYMDETFEKKIKEKTVLTFGDNYLLFELSFINYPANIHDMIKLMQDSGYKPVLAHPERYPYFHGSVDNYIRIKEQDCNLQINAIALTGYYGPGPKKLAEEIIENNLVDFVGSDMHHLRHADALKESLYTPGLQELLSGKLKNTLL
ncbi:tyrosine-protein phosphatase [Pedobacter insulae]|uniref:protein-tyrosine-phosphatase n=1 Tax=Pedobacter insulae TaxID=414048 RepID=A0A1I2TRD3_9SPHI|nr:CpsB/CapC family capsule biosynthesis tyrosine phosphatase [Pedobacter insulae]SFG67470.1 Tyrosine-protein phosphatase YwqE [Pedobacter insulae]